MDVWMIRGSAGSPTVATMAALPAAVTNVADPMVYIGTWAVVSRINCKLMFAAIACRVYLPGTLAIPGALNLVLGSSFIRL